MPEPVDLIIRGGYVITVDPERRMFRDGAIAIRGDRIAAVDRTRAVLDAFRAGREIDATGKVVIPGLIDSHMHLNEGPRGVVPDDIPAIPWIREWMHPIFAALDPDEEYLLARLALAEALKTGTTTVVEGGTVWYPEMAARAALESGARLYLGRRTWDIPQRDPKFRMTTDQALRRCEELIARYHGAGSGRLRIFVHLIGVGTQSDALLMGARELAQRHGLVVSMHQSIAEEEVAEFQASHRGLRPIEHFAEIGALDERLRLIHLIALSQREAELVRATGVKPVHCVTCALRLGYGATAIGRYPELIRAGVPVALGCDGGNCSNFFDMVRAMHLVATLYKDARRDVSLVPAEMAIEMATRNGAISVLAEEELGSIEVGKLADLTLFDTSRLEWQPLTNVVYNLVYAATGASVDTVLVGGQVVVEKGRLTRVDEEALLAEARAKDWRRWLAERAGLPYQQRWPEL